jgi:hypothetical protein
MNRKEYNSDPRYAKVLETMDLLGIMDVTTTRQHKNGTIIWKLPIKINYPGNKERLIEVGSFSTGYVRNQNCGYSNYQLNKRCEGEPEYFKLSNGDYRKFTTRACVLIPVEIDRLEYLLKYCIKNYYIKNANQVPNGDFYPKWMYENKQNDCGHYERIRDLENKLEQERDGRCEEVADFQRESGAKIRDLENKLDTIKRIADYE